MSVLLSAAVVILVDAVIISTLEVWNRIDSWMQSHVSSEYWSAALSGMVLFVICLPPSAASLYILSFGMDVSWFSLLYGPTVAYCLILFGRWSLGSTAGTVEAAVNTDEDPTSDSDRQTLDTPSSPDTDVRRYECANCGTEFEREDARRGDLCPDCENGYLTMDGEEVSLRDGE